MTKSTSRVAISTRSESTGWHREDIKAAIRKRGVTLTELARRNGLSSASFRMALMRPNSKKVEGIIARFLGVKPQVLWPERYAPKKANG